MRKKNGQAINHSHKVVPQMLDAGYSIFDSGYLMFDSGSTSSSMHLNLYLTELSFRWFNRDPKKVVTETGKRKVIWKPNPLLEQLTLLLSFACDTQLRWKKTDALRQITSNAF